jgi:hypothetical protein
MHATFCSWRHCRPAATGCLLSGAYCSLPRHKEVVLFQRITGGGGPGPGGRRPTEQRHASSFFVILAMYFVWKRHIADQE